MNHRYFGFLGVLVILQYIIITAATVSRINKYRIISADSNPKVAQPLSDSENTNFCEQELVDCEDSIDLDSLNLDFETKSKDYLLYINETEASTLNPEDIKYIIFNKGKKPSNRFTDWMKFVKDKKCPKSLDFYSQIFEDLLPFYDVVNGKTISKITKEMLEKSYSTRFVHLIIIKNKKIQNPDLIPYDMANLIQNLLHLLPENITIPINHMDEDLSLPSDDNDESPYFDNNDSLKRNSCFRENYNNNQTNIVPGTIAHSHGSFIKPVSFTTTAKLFPVLSFCKRNCFKDLIYGTPISLNNYDDNIKWEAKKDKIIWRGLNSGTKIYPKSLHQFSHRFRLVDWGLKFKNTVEKNLKIGVDIGFHQFVNCENEIDCEYAKRNSKILPFVPYNQMFEFKYLVYVDGNSWAFRLASYLASNSLVFYNGVYNFW